LNKEMGNRYGTIKVEKPYKYYQKFGQKAIKIIKRNPFLFIKEYLYGIIDMYFSVETNSYEKYSGNKIKSFDVIDFFKNYGLLKTLNKLAVTYSPELLVYTFSILLFLGSEYFLAIIGIIKLIQLRNWLLIIVIAFPILYFTLVTGAAGNGRFKLPVIPFYLLLSSVAFLQTSKEE